MKVHKMIYKAAMLTLAAVMTLTTVSAQEYVTTPVQISKEKVRIDGKVCYSHVVQEKQTLFSISKAYEVSIEEIYKYNPTLQETGLKKNSIIIIPSKEATAAAETKPAAETKAASKAAATKATAETKTATTAAKPAVEEKKTVVTEQKAKRVHIAKWYEDLDVIAEQYGVTAEEIIAANKLKGRKLSKRQKLVIPYPGEVTVTPEEPEIKAVPATEAQPETVEEVVDSTTITETEQEPVEKVTAKTKVNASIILPLTTAEGEPSRNNMDFYSGALLAVYDLAESGIDCNLNVYDIMNSNTQFNVDAIVESDVVIGPVSTADITKLFHAVSGANAVVSPLDPRAERLTREHPEFLHAPTPHHILYRDLIKWVEEDINEGDKAVIITEKGARNTGITSIMKEALDSSSVAYSSFSYSILEGRDVTEPLIAMMTTEGTNRIIVASESEAFVNDVVRNINLLIYNNLDIVLYAPSKIRGFETIEVENLHNTAMHVSLGYYIDYESPEVKAFLKKFRALYNTEPSQFAFQGYDITRYFLGMSAKYGADWKNHLSETPGRMLQSTYDFVRSGNGGYINKGVRRITYDKGYTVKTQR